MPDFSNKKDIRRATKEAKLAQRQDQEIVTQLMSTTPGRSWMLRKLEACHVFSSSFNAQPHFMAFSEGERNIGLQLLNDIMAACPDHYIQMMRERNERDAARSRDDSPNGGDESSFDSGDNSVGGEESGDPGQ